MGEIFTIGHSTRLFKDFIGLLKSHSVKQLVDVRTIPKSRHNPQFNKTILSKKLRSAGIGYRHMKALGGLRPATPNSKNLGWRNPAFRGYADYMQTQDFSQAILKLKLIASKKKTAIMCAEALPWRCHRSLIGDVFIKDHWKVFDIMTSRKSRLHKKTSFMRVAKR